MIQPLWRTVWRFLKKLKTELPYDPAIPLLGIYPEKTIIQKESYTKMFIAALFTIARGPLFIAVRGPLTIAASLVAGHRLQTRRLSSCGSWAQLLCGMTRSSRPGLEPVSPALAGRFSTTAPPGKSLSFTLMGNLGVLTLYFSVRLCP